MTEVQDGGALLGREEKGDAGESGEPDAYGEACERGYGCDLDRGDPRAGVEAEADRPAREGRKSECVAEGARNE